jgi:hypothetical protein
MWTIFCDLCINFFEQPNMKGNHWIEWKAFKCCYHVLNWFFLPKPGFLGIYLNFQLQKLLKDQYISHILKPKSYQINSIKSYSSRSFQRHQRHIPVPLKFLVKKSFNIQELLHHKSKCHHATKPMHPFWWWVFQRHQEQDLKHHSSVDLITTKQNKTKQNKLPSFIDRWQGHIVTTHPLFWEHLCIKRHYLACNHQHNFNF